MIMMRFDLIWRNLKGKKIHACELEMTRWWLDPRTSENSGQASCFYPEILSRQDLLRQGNNLLLLFGVTSWSSKLGLLISWVQVSLYACRLWMPVFSYYIFFFFKWKRKLFNLVNGFSLIETKHMYSTNAISFKKPWLMT